MQNEKTVIWEEGEYSYPMAFGFVPNIMSYLHEDGKVRPCMLVVPGGGYCVVSPTEGEIVAKRFYEAGYQAFVLTYTTNILMSAPLKTQPMEDLSRAIRYIRKHAGEFRVDPGKVVVCGFSAGGHLCGSVCVHYNDIADKSEKYAGLSNRPDAAILSYPVISSGSQSHSGSFSALLGMEIDPATGEQHCTGTEAELEYMSLEKHVTPDTPPCFLWQTATDELVPVENSYLFAESCRKSGVPHAHHVFSGGPHGLSLADEVWASQDFGEPYTMDQVFRIVSAVKDGTIPMPEEAKKELLAQLSWSEGEVKAEFQPVEEAAVWPDLAVTWLKNCCRIG